MMYDASTPRYFPIGRMRRMKLQCRRREEMRNDIVFAAGLHAIATRINVTDGGHDDVSGFAFRREKSLFCRNAFFKKAVLLLVELSEAVRLLAFCSASFEANAALVIHMDTLPCTLVYF